MTKSHSVIYIAGIALFLLMFARPTWAYLDPASGSMILQVVLAAVAAAAITVKAFWHRIRAMFGPTNRDDPDVPDRKS
jgi:uncharacterized membrane protein YhhN